MTVARDRWARWARQIDGKARVFKAPKPPVRIEKLLEVRFVAPARCEVCGASPLAAGASELCARCWHDYFHEPGCGCPWDPVRLARFL